MGAGELAKARESLNGEVMRDIVVKEQRCENLVRIMHGARAEGVGAYLILAPADRRWQIDFGLQRPVDQ